MPYPCAAAISSAGWFWAGPHTSGLPAGTNQGFVRWEEASPSPASLGFGPATPMPPGAPLTAQAESGQDPTRVSSRPDPGFASWGGAAPSMQWPEVSVFVARFCSLR